MSIISSGEGGHHEDLQKCQTVLKHSKHWDRAKREGIRPPPCVFPCFPSLSAVTKAVWIMDDEERIFSFHPPPHHPLCLRYTRTHRAENSAAVLMWCEIKSTLERRRLLLGNSTLVLLHLTIPPSSLQHHLHLSVQGYFSQQQAFWNMMYMWL